MSSYSATCRAAVANPRSIGILREPASSTDRARLQQFTISASGTPADNAIIWTLQRTSSAGTFTGVAGAAHDPAEGAATLSPGENATVEPTYTASSEIWDNAVNQRATMFVMYAPGREIVLPVTNNAGLGFKAAHATFTGNAEVTFTWDE